MASAVAACRLIPTPASTRIFADMVFAPLSPYSRRQECRSQPESYAKWPIAFFENLSQKYLTIT
jgi:hypothetical protein